MGNGLLVLMLTNYCLFAADRLAHTQLMRFLPLYAAKWKWWQFITHAFYHCDFGHLAGNMFMLWVFGRSLEADEGTGGLVMYYLLCAAGVTTSGSEAGLRMAP
jgi:membrane associated rhomboid family serine protease